MNQNKRATFCFHCVSRLDQAGAIPPYNRLIGPAGKYAPAKIGAFDPPAGNRYTKPLTIRTDTPTANVAD